MSPLIETIRLENGKFYNLSSHELRMQNSLSQLFGKEVKIDLSGILKGFKHPAEGLYKCRVTYTDDMEEVEFEPYIPASINSLKLIVDDDIVYNHKYSDRSALKRHFNEREKADDILIVKNRLVTDTFYANIVFKKNDQWFTPSSYLLPGTQRAGLLAGKIIQEVEISVDDIWKYTSFKLINAMLLFEGVEVDVKNII